MDHVVTVEHHVVHGAYLAEAFVRMVHGPAAVVDEAARGCVEPFHVVPAFAPHDVAVRDIAHLVVVLRDVTQDLHHDGRIVVLEGVPIEQVVLLFGQHALEDAL